MGPEATAELYLRVISLFQSQGAVNDEDFPEMVILNLPLPDVVKEINSKDAIKALSYGVEKLEKAEVDFIAIPCNTANYFIDEIKCNVPIINLPEEVSKQISSKKIGVLGTKFTIDNGLFKPFFEEIIYPTEEQGVLITGIILNILSGDKNDLDKEILNEIILEMKSNGAEKVILGCTELPLLIKDSKDIVDTIGVLAKSVFEYSGGKKNENYII